MEPQQRVVMQPPGELDLQRMTRATQGVPWSRWGRTPPRSPLPHLLCPVSHYAAQSSGAAAVATAAEPVKRPEDTELHFPDCMHAVFDTLLSAYAHSKGCCAGVIIHVSTTVMVVLIGLSALLIEVVQANIMK